MGKWKRREIRRRKDEYNKKFIEKREQERIQTLKQISKDDVIPEKKRKKKLTDRNENYSRGNSVFLIL